MGRTSVPKLSAEQKHEAQMWRRVAAANLRSMRRRAGMTQGQLAARAGITPQHLSKIERSTCSLTLDTLARLALALGTLPGVLLDPGALLGSFNAELLDFAREHAGAWDG